jgi:hypothetical protein
MIPGADKIHTCIDIENLMRVHGRKSLDFFTADDGTPLTDSEVRAKFKAALAKGHRLYPLCKDGECPDFDPYVNGCPGHVLEKVEGEDKANG